MPALSPFGIVLFALQAAVGYAAYRSLSGTGTVAAVVGVCTALLGVAVLLGAGLIAGLAVDAVVVGLAVLTGSRVDAGPARS